MTGISKAVFDTKYKVTDAETIKQWDRGIKLEIYGLCLPPVVEVHFSIADTTVSTTMIGNTVDQVTTVEIPEEMLRQDRDITAYIYITTLDSGQTVYTINIGIEPRAKPENLDIPENKDLFRRTVAAVNSAATRAEDARDTAAIHAQDAAEAAQDAQDCAEQISGKVDTAKADIDKYVANKESELKGDTGNVYFASFKVVGGRLKMYSDPTVTKIVFTRRRSRLSYRVWIGG